MNEIAILERSVGYALGCLALVAGTPAGSPTPCRDWDLLDLLRHLDDSCAVLAEAVRGDVEPPGRPGDDLGPPFAVGTAERLAGSIGARARHTLGEWIVTGTRHDVLVGGRTLPAHVVVLLGALEVAVHGWDVAQACGDPRPLPAGLAQDLLDVASVLVGEEDRPGRFAPVTPGPRLRPDDVLLTFLGRTPQLTARGRPGAPR